MYILGSSTGMPSPPNERGPIAPNVSAATGMMVWVGARQLPRSLAFLKELAARMKQQSGEERAFQYLMQQLLVAVQRGLDINGLPPSGLLVNVFIQLGSDVLNTIKDNTMTIGTSVMNTYLLIESDAFVGKSNNSNVLQTIQAQEIAMDTSLTSLIDISIDMNEGSLVLMFNDVIDIASQRVDRFGSITLQDANTSTAQVPLTIPVTMLSPSTGFRTAVTIQLTESDITSIKSALNVASSLADSHIIIRADAFNDYQGNDILSVTDDNGIQAYSYIPDMTPPLLQSFDFNRDSGEISLTFDEPMDAGSFVASLVRVQVDSLEISNLFVELSTAAATAFSPYY